jgi:hypothetical protein
MFFLSDAEICVIFIIFTNLLFHCLSNFPLKYDLPHISLPVSNFTTKNTICVQHETTSCSKMPPLAY